MDWKRDRYTVTCDPLRINRKFVADFLATSYWATDIPADTVSRSIDGSLCFSLLEEGNQIGFARVISDRATIAYLGDVFVAPQSRGRGLGKWLVECAMAHPDLQGLRRWILVTQDAHGLYGQLGFKALARPERYMELHNPNAYRGS